MHVEQVGPYFWRSPPEAVPGMRMPGLVVADEPLNINCGVRLLRTDRDAVAIASQIGALVDRL